MFTWKKVASKLVNFYDEVLSRDEAHNPISVEIAVSELNVESYAMLVMNGFKEAQRTFEQSQEVLREEVLEAANAIVNCFEQGGKVMVCGNGGSAADSQHFAAELLGRFISHDRRGLPAMALTSDSAFLTAWSNDVSYEQVFARQVEAFGKPGDVLFGISTSGRSKNVAEAFKVARETGIICVSLLGGDGGEILPLSDVALVVPSDNTQRIQEVHMLVLHLICELVENRVIASPLVAIGSLSQVLDKEKESSWELRSAVPAYIRRSGYPE